MGSRREASQRPGKRNVLMILLLTQRYLATGEAVAQEHGDGLLLLDGEVVEVVGELHQLPLLPVQLEEGPEVLAQCSRS